MIHNLGKIEITDRQITSALMAAAMHTRSAVRADAAGAAVFPRGMIDRYRQRLDDLAFEHLRGQFGQGWRPDPDLAQDYAAAVEDGRVDEVRSDALTTGGARADAGLTPGSAGFLRDFDYVHREILEERRPQLNAGMLFPADGTVPLGAPTHTARRAIVTGGAKWHSKGDAFPLVKAGYLEEQFRTGFVVCAVEQSFFEGLAIGFAGMQNYRLEGAGAVRAIEEFLNRIAFYGEPARQIYGALTYPHLAKMVLSTQFGGSSTGRQVAAALHTLVNRPMIASGGVFRPTRLVTSEEVHAYLTTTPLDTSGGDTTIAEFFLKGQSPTTGIREIEIAHELSASEMTANSVGNPSGYHGILCYRGDDRLSLSHVLPQSPTFLPVWNSSPIDTLHVAFASTGGITMNDVGNNILGFVQL